VTYHNEFTKVPEAEPTSKASNALQVALDIRKFEISLYWTRAAYFWAFSGAALAAYLAALTGENVQNRGEALLLISCIGIVFSSAWYMVNRASKYWQLNWELHVDLLEDAVNGPLYKTVLGVEPSLKNLVGPYPYSVSKVNQLLSLYVAILFFGLAVDSTWTYYPCILKCWPPFPSVVLGATALAVGALHKFGSIGSMEMEPTRSIRRTKEPT
jgi:hypothetical protein